MMRLGKTFKVMLNALNLVTEQNNVIVITNDVNHINEYLKQLLIPYEDVVIYPDYKFYFHGSSTTIQLFTPQQYNDWRTENGWKLRNMKCVVL